MLISFIIPVYNVEKYITKCIDSILTQTFEDYEIILVDDGSSDASGEICDFYAEKHLNINVIHKKNGGLSDARNAGIKIAKGDYIAFVDSDDYIGKDILQKVEPFLKSGRDVLFLNAIKIFPDGSTIPLGDGYDAQLINQSEKNEILEHIAKLPKFPGSACTKMIRREIIIKNNLFFQKGLLSEDIDWTIRLLCVANTFAYFEDGDYYFYRQSREGSITSSSSDKGLECLCYIISKWASKDRGRKYQNEINAYLAYEYMVALFNYSNLSGRLKEKYKKFFKEYKWILRFGRSKRLKFVCISSRVVGIELTSKLLKIKRRYL